jgi:transposase
MGACRRCPINPEGTAMQSMPAPAPPVTVGVDTHLETHVAAVVDQTGRLRGTKGFPASTRGYVALVTWAEGFGPVERIGIEGTGTDGAGLARFVRAYGLPVVAVNRPDRSLRRRRGKSDPIDAQAAARATLAGVAVTAPKTRDGQVEMIRVLRVARRGALKARVAAAEQLYGVLYSAPEELCQPLLGLKTNRAWLRQHGTTTRIARRGIESSTRPRRKIVRKYLDSRPSG